MMEQTAFLVVWTLGVLIIGLLVGFVIGICYRWLTEQADKYGSSEK